MAYPFLRRTILPLVRRFVLKEVEGVEHIPKEGSFILVANHSSYLEGIFLNLIVSVERHRKVHFITKQSIYFAYWPIASRWLGMIPRYDRQPAGALEEAKRQLLAGEIVGIFPEGTINMNPELLGRGKTGAVRLALATKRPILPVGYFGPHTGSAKESLKRFFRPRQRIRIRIGEPFHLNEFYDQLFSHELLRRATSVIMQRISELCGKAPHAEDAGQLVIPAAKP